jgi:hypothetical protein
LGLGRPIINIRREALMTDLIYIPLEVFGIGFATAMCIAGLIKLLTDVIRHFSKDEKMMEE